MFSKDSHTYGSHPSALITWLIFFPLELRSMLSAFESRDVGLWLHWPMACSSAVRCSRQGHKAVCLPPGPLPHTHAHTLSLSHSVRMLILGTQSPCCEEARPHKEATRWHSGRKSQLGPSRHQRRSSDT